MVVFLLCLSGLVWCAAASAALLPVQINLPICFGLGAMLSYALTRKSPQITGFFIIVGGVATWEVVQLAWGLADISLFFTTAFLMAVIIVDSYREVRPKQTKLAPLAPKFTIRTLDDLYEEYRGDPAAVYRATRGKVVADEYTLENGQTHVVVCRRGVFCLGSGEGGTN
jgi:hypothetical protein